jgi:glycosyltransferase involved in cell wall biosynthesis
MWFVAALSCAILTLGYWCIVLVDVLRGIRTIKILTDESTLPDAMYPTLSVIIAARNEKKKIAEALYSLIATDYPRKQIIVVDDRSVDGTRELVGKIFSEYSNCRLIEIQSVPDGWLGKNHALHTGFAESTGELLLFTDADVHFGKMSLKAAVGYFLRERADHLAVSPRIIGRSFLLRGFIRYFLLSFTIFFRPWQSMHDRSRRGGMGIGAFNLISRTAYESIGTHRALARRPDDDLQLGINIKRNGLRQRFITAKDYLHLGWYDSLGAAVRGLEKNSFAGMNYSIILSAGAVAGQFFGYLFPFAGILIFDDWLRWFYIIVLVFMGMVYHVIMKKLTDTGGSDYPLLPVYAIIFIYTFSRAIILTLVRGGIRWRDTFYSLESLRRD